MLAILGTDGQQDASQHGNRGRCFMDFAYEREERPAYLNWKRLLMGQGCNTSNSLLTLI